MSWLRSPWVSGGLAAVALGVVAYQVFTSGASRARPGKAASASAPRAAPPPTAAAQPKPAFSDSSKPSSPVKTGTLAIDRRFVQSRVGDWLDAPRRDPFLRVTTQETPARPSPVSGWKLSAIWRQTGSQVATINGTNCQEGDEIEGYRIERIQGGQVWFRGPTGSESLDFAKTRSETNAAPNRTNVNVRPGPTNLPYRKLPLIEN